MDTEVKCNCQHCNQHITFAPAQAGQTVKCPHCNLETRLFIPPPAPRPFQERDSVNRSTSEPKTAAKTIPIQRKLALAGFIIGGIVIAVLIWRHFDNYNRQIQNTQDFLTRKSDLKPPGPSKPSPQKWEYATFEWHETEFDEVNHPNQALTTFIHFANDDFWQKEWEPDGMPTVHLNDVLREIGGRGWEMVSFDGTRYIFRRPDDQSIPHTFNLERHWKNLPKAQ